jgi:hypothetical protein
VPSNVGHGGLRPLLTDWGPNERTLLNLSRSRGPLAVRFAEGVLEPLLDCRVNGTYTYRPGRANQVEEQIIESEDELHAKMPAFGAKFEAALQDAGKLHVRMSVVGNYEANKAFTRKDLEGDCSRATHVASFVTVGAFRLFTLASNGASGSLGIPAADLGASAHSSEQSLNEAGDEAACDRATREDTEPPDACSTSLMLNLAGLDPPPTQSTGTPRAIFFGAAGGAIVTLGVASGIALHASSAQSAELAKSPYDRDPNARSSIQAQSTTANILFVGAGVLGIGAGVAAFTTHWKTGAATPVTATLAPWIDESGAGIGAHGSF